MRKILWMVGLFLNSFAFAQLGEDFSDGEIAHQPTWMGDTGRVKVNANLQLQTKLINRSDTLHLVATNTYRLNTEWIFYLQLNFDPSTGNLFRYYLFSNVANLQGSLKGYYFQIGESGNTDSYDLFRQTNNGSSKIIDGPAKPRAITDTIKTFVKIIYDKIGNWYLYTRNPDSVDWVLEGYTFDMSHTIANYTGIYVRHTSTRSDKFIFDDLTIRQHELDLLAPYRVNQQVERDSILSIEFNEAIDTQSIMHSTSYMINRYGHPKSIFYDVANPNIIEINLGNILNTGTHIIKLPLMKDLYGNQQNNVDSFLFDFIKQEQYETGDILLSELMIDPSPSISLPNVEYIEIYNASTKLINLNNWSISDGTSSGVLMNYSMTPKSFLILCKESDTQHFANYGKYLGLSNWPTLNNAGDHIVLRSNTNKIIDEVAYDISWYKNSSKKDGGYSLERIDFRNKCTAFYNWEASSSIDGGTPGKVNSIWRDDIKYEIFRITNIEFSADSVINIQLNRVPDTTKMLNSINFKIGGINTYASSIIANKDNYLEYKLVFPIKFSKNKHYKIFISNLSTCDGNYLERMQYDLFFKVLDDTSRLIITEIQFDPYPEIELPNREYIEIFNPNSYEFEIQGWKFGYNTSEYLLPSMYVKANEYYILCHPRDSALLSKYGKIIVINNFPTLSNTSARLYLKNHIHNIMSEVNYHYLWHDETSKRNGGWSIEQIDPYSICNNAINWRSSKNSTGGSPGHQNSIANFHSDKNDIKIVHFKNKNQKVFEFKLSKSLNGTVFNPFQFYLVGPRMQLYFPDSINIDSPRYSTIKIYYSQFIPGGKYEFVLHSLPICGRNDTTLQFSFLINEAVKDDNIIITELMVDPSPPIDFPESEYIELYNSSMTSYDIKIGIKKGRYFNEFELDSFNQFSYIVLVDKKYKELWNNYSNVIFVEDLISLNNSQDSIYLIINDVIKDSVFYNYKIWDKDKQLGGYAIELDYKAKLCHSSKAWGNAKQSQGSPGSANSYELNENDKRIKFSSNSNMGALELYFNQNCTLLNKEGLEGFEYSFYNNKIVFKNLDEKKDDLLKIPIQVKSCYDDILDTIVFYQQNSDKNYQSIIINEVLFNSFPNASDFIELYNKSSKAINLKELYLLNFTENMVLKDSSSIVAYDYFVLPNCYVVITENRQSVIDNYRSSNKDFIIEINDLIEMNDKEGRIYLMDQKGGVLDYIEYSEDMHLTWLKDVDGRSLERRNIFEEGNVSHNWTSASDAIGKASPASINSQSINGEHNSHKTFSIKNKIISPNADGYADFLELEYDLKNDIMVISANVYNQQGRFVSTIFNAFTLSNKGSLIWDITQANRKIDSGLYLMYIEGFSESGTYNKYKLPFIVDDN